MFAKSSKKISQCFNGRSSSLSFQVNFYSFLLLFRYCSYWLKNETFIKMKNLFYCLFYDYYLNIIYQKNLI